LGQQIKNMPDAAATRLILLASLAQRGDTDHAEQAGFAGYLTKPLRQHLLHDCVAQVLARDADAAPDIVVRHTLTDARQVLHRAVPQSAAVRILLVEDNRTNQIVAREMLGKLGYFGMVEIANNGVEALAALAQQPYDLVLMDGRMPEIDGFEAAQRIRRGEAGAINQQVPIVAMTALALHGDRQRCFDAGMTGYLSKPVQPLELARVIAAQLHQTVLAQHAPPSAPEPVEHALMVFHTADLMERIGERRIAQMVIQQFLLDVPIRIQELHTALAADDLAGVRFKAHSIKGLAANISAGRLREVATQLEAATDTIATIANLSLLSADLSAAFAELKPRLLNWINS
jgi:CheY-like chemotaxis protein